MYSLNVLRACSFSVVVIFAGCFSPDRPAGDFVLTTDFHLLQTCTIGEINLSGMKWSEQSGASLAGYTALKLAAEMEKRGFTRSEKNADFVVRAEWNKALRVNLGHFSTFEHIPEMKYRDEAASRPRVMCSLTLELYNPKEDKIFWRASLPDCVYILNLRESIISEAIERALSSFPSRIELDPDLGIIQ